MAHVRLSHVISTSNQCVTPEGYFALLNKIWNYDCVEEKRFKKRHL